MLTGKGGGLFGFTDLYGGYAGGQAEYVRVPYADVGPRKVPDELTDEQVLFLTDIFPTGYSAIDWAQLKGGETVAVFGCGPVGLMAQKVAWLKGAKRVIALDVLDYRLEMSRKACKTETINAKNKDAVEQIRAMTGGRGADVCVDAVGMEAYSSVIDKADGLLHMEKGNINALKMAMDAVRRGGTVSVVGVYGMSYHDFPLAQQFDKGVTLRMGQALVQKYIDLLITMVKENTIRLDDIITHRLKLSDAPKGYEIFNEKKENCVKVIMNP
jgi:alcohol dehydrogenase